MKKEIIITITILILIIIGNIITQKNTINTVEAVSKHFEELKEEAIKEDKNKEKIDSKIEEIDKLWDEKSEIMAYYIEHDEIEKVGTELTKLKADLETKEYNVAIEYIDNCVFLLEHIKDKTALRIFNIF